MINEEEKQWINENFPELVFHSCNTRISGELHFKAFYSPDEKLFIRNPENGYENNFGFIEDCFEVEISNIYGNQVPVVREISKKIEKTKNQLGLKDLMDLHINGDGTFCLCVKTEESLILNNSFNLIDFFEKLLIPFLYYQSYYYKYQIEPWEGYSHGNMGILESYLKKSDKSNKDLINIYFNYLSKNIRLGIKQNIKLRGHNNCLCGSGNKFRNCHKNAYFGYYKLVNDYKAIFKD